MARRQSRLIQSMFVVTIDPRRLTAEQRAKTARAIKRGGVIDREWFAQHPDRSTYVRAALRDEFADPTHGRDWFVAVRQLSSGRLLHQFFCLDGKCPDLSSELAACIAFAIDQNFERFSESFDAFKSAVRASALAAATPAGRT